MSKTYRGRFTAGEQRVIRSFVHGLVRMPLRDRIVVAWEILRGVRGDV